MPPNKLKVEDAYPGINKFLPFDVPGAYWLWNRDYGWLRRENSWTKEWTVIGSIDNYSTCIDAKYGNCPQPRIYPARTGLRCPRCHQAEVWFDTHQGN